MRILLTLPVDDLVQKRISPLSRDFGRGGHHPPPASNLQPAFRHTMDQIVNKYRGTSLIRKHRSIGPYSRSVPRAL